MFRAGVFLLIALLAAPAGADIYKWTDNQGRVHYGDQPPSNATATQIKSGTSKPAEAQAEALHRQAADKAAEKKLDQAKIQEAESKQRAASEETARRKAEACRRARGNLATLSQAHTRVKKAGQADYLDETGREVEMANTNREIAENCP